MQELCSETTPTGLLNSAADCKQEFTRKPLSQRQASFVYSRTVGVKNLFTSPEQLGYVPFPATLDNTQSELSIDFVHMQRFEID